ncbi:MAG: Asp-tRNA(Asn)/Glu-tRNA(Gln) amidotransferase GatCAB subunit A, partial [Planctomycetaceae bacterium]|nr:Asp-tRNA(Asn)/Glu-tRNA(Gln) amidotransferase GatCAB subunit A [Planctomycetaceae bacterium]
MIDATTEELLGKLNSGEISSRELTTAYLDRIEAVDSRVKAFVHVDRNKAIADAETIDAKRKQGAKVGKLAGLPVAVKDVLCTKGEPTTCCSKMLKNFIAPYDAHVITRLREADAV